MILAVLITAFLAGVSLVARGQKRPEISDPPLEKAMARRTYVFGRFFPVFYLAFFLYSAALMTGR